MPMEEIRKDIDGSVWQFRVSLGRDPLTGRYPRATEHFHGPSQTGKQPPKEVRDAYAAFVTKARAGLATSKRGHTLNDAWDAFLGVADLAPYTRVNYVLQWDKHVRPGIGKTAVADLAPMTLTQFYSGLVVEGKSPVSVRKINAYVRNACKAAINLNWIVHNPAVSARLPRVSARRHLEVPTPEHVAKLIELATEENDELGVFFELAVGMGARRGEIGALRRSNLVEFFDGSYSVRVTHALYRVDGKVGLKDTKSHQERSVHLGPELTKLVRSHLAKQKMRANAAQVEMAEDPFLFARDASGTTPWPPDYTTHRFTVLWARVEALTGAPHAKLHDLRHFHITELIDAGVSMPVIRDRVGHSSLQVTNGYAGSRKEADQAAAAIFERRRTAVV